LPSFPILGRFAFSGSVVVVGAVLSQKVQVLGGELNQLFGGGGAGSSTYST
jgi:hypothetical protein